MVMILPPYVVTMATLDLPMRVFRAEVQTYARLPEYYRDAEWSVRMEQRYIESLFLGKLEPEFRAIRKGNYYELVDGLQQVATIQKFCANGFATARAKDDPRQPILLEPNKRWSKLPQQRRDFFDNLIVHVRYTNEEMEDWEAADLHRRLNAQRPLTRIESIWTYPSYTHDRAKECMDHGFWQVIYKGNPRRSHVFLAALYMLFLEAQKNTNMTDLRIRAFAAGLQDMLITQQVVETVHKRMDHIMHLFAGTTLQFVNEVIPVYQAVYFLDIAGLNFKHSSEGCLTPWYQEVQEEFKQARRTFGADDILRQMTQERCQVNFWAQHQSRLLETDGLRFFDTRRQFSKEDIRAALERQRGLCPECDLPITDPFDGHHMIAYAEGGMTTAENCAVLHTECHKSVHTRSPNARITFQVIDKDVE